MALQINKISPNMQSLTIFWDTDVFIDLISKREPFYLDAGAILKITQESLDITHMITTASILNTIYVKKYTPNEYPYILDILNTHFVVIEIPATTIYMNFNLKYKDFEDSVQYLTALYHQTDIILTRNIKHYKAIETKVLKKNIHKKFRNPELKSKTKPAFPKIPLILTPNQLLKLLEDIVVNTL